MITYPKKVNHVAIHSEQHVTWQRQRTGPSLTFCDGPQHQDTGLLDDPVGVEEEPFEKGQ